MMKNNGVAAEMSQCLQKQILTTAKSVMYELSIMIIIDLGWENALEEVTMQHSTDLSDRIRLFLYFSLLVFCILWKFTLLIDNFKYEILIQYSICADYQGVLGFWGFGVLVNLLQRILDR